MQCFKILIICYITLWPQQQLEYEEDNRKYVITSSCGLMHQLEYEEDNRK